MTLNDRSWVSAAGRVFQSFCSRPPFSGIARKELCHDLCSKSGKQIRPGDKLSGVRFKGQSFLHVKQRSQKEERLKSLHDAMQSFAEHFRPLIAVLLGPFKEPELPEKPARSSYLRNAAIEVTRAKGGLGPLPGPLECTEVQLCRDPDPHRPQPYLVLYKPAKDIKSKAKQAPRHVRLLVEPGVKSEPRYA